MGYYDPISQTKLCPRCGERKPVSDFSKRSGHGRDPYFVYCRGCDSARNKAWAGKNRQQKLATVRRWYANNIADVRAYDAERWRRPETRRRRRALVAANRERYSAYGHKHRALKAAAVGVFSAEDIARIKKAQRSKCAVCRRRLGRVFHKDHIVALSKRGTNRPSNIQLLCVSCNTSKSDRDPIEFMRERGFLL